MSVNMQKLENNTATLEITVPSEDFKKYVDKSYRKNVQKFNVPGFRKGKVPKEIIEKMYGEEVFYEDAMELAVEESYPVAIDDSKIEPVDRPQVDVKEIGKGKDFVYTATVTVKPEVELGQYKGVEVAKVEYPVTDEDIDKQIDAMRQKNARIITKEDGVAENGDTAVIDFEGFVDDVAFEGGKGENYSLEIGSGTFIPGFEEQLIGKKTGEEVEVNVSFPEDYRAENLAGKPSVFKVKINEIKYKELLPVDDEFAKDVSEFETLDELKADIRKKLQETNDAKAKRDFEDAVIKKVVENAKADIPEVMVTKEIDYMIEELSYRLRYQGITLEQYAMYLNTTEEQIREEYRETCFNKVKTALVIEKISKIENFDVTEEEIQAELEKMAAQYGQQADKFKATIKERERNIIKSDVAANKTVDFLIQNAVTAA
ncbi:trigger factor [Oxobacter pfennigii]|uniref:Trigger factor n=1 Tax=Oxobacter pfennigii TaxID=36849 RepID=A0A0P8X5G1_9CLOT|nr:trigger factor [Oxobacter pfennigii]KPU46038.1 trigger factor [Oxobacter pfennigii]